MPDTTPCPHNDMGQWWPCNFGADEVRACPDCALIEKRLRMPSPVCGCLRCVAADRLNALSDVFEHLGDYAAADCCNDWALRAGPAGPDPIGQHMAAALVRGEHPAEWSDTR